MISFQSSDDNENYKQEFTKYLGNFFNEERVLKKMKLDYIF